MKLNLLITSTSVAIACAIPAVCAAEFSVYASLSQSLSVAVSPDYENVNAPAELNAIGEQTTGVKLRASYGAEKNTFPAVVTSADSKVAAKMPQAIVPGYQPDLSNRSRVSLELSSVDPDIAGLDASIEGGVMYRHDW